MDTSTLQSLEERRIHYIQALEMIDSPPETCFDTVAKIAAHYAKTPIALITFIDAETQWFKASVGLERREIPRSWAYCNETLKQGNLEIPDTLADGRFKSSPLTIGHPSVRFYYGISLLSPTGIPVGTLCFMDYMPRRLTEYTKSMLQLLKPAIEAFIEARENGILRQKLEDSIQSQAKWVQLGRLAGSLAHEINTPLTVILGRTKQILYTCDADKKNPLAQTVTPLAKKVETAALHTAKVIASIRTASRDEQYDPLVEYKLQNILNDVNTLIEESLKAENIIFEMRGDVDTLIKVRPTQMIQVLLNLTQNSIQALKDQPKKVISLHCTRTTTEVILDFFDSGQGVLPSFESKLFHGQFTTKNAQEGTGLGLALCKKMLESQDASIEYLHLTPERWTFRMRFKIAAQK